MSCEASTVSFADGLQTPRAALAALAPGGAQSLVTSAVAFPGTQTFLVTVDPDALVRDSDPGNNVSTLVTQTGAAAAPDLAVAFAEMQPRPAFPTETVQLLATVRGVGFSLRRGGQTEISPQL